MISLGWKEYIFLIEQEKQNVKYLYFQTYKIVNNTVLRDVK